MRRAAALLVAVAAAGADAGCAMRIQALPVATTPPGTGSWTEVQQLPADAAVRVETPQGPRVGRYVSASDQDVTLDIGGATATLPRAEVRRVVALQRQMAPGVLRAVLLAATAGATWGNGTAAANRGPEAPMLAAGWGPLGMVFSGLAGGFGAISERVVYDVAPAP